MSISNSLLWKFFHMAKYETGELKISVQGPNSSILGVTSVYNSEGVVLDEFVLPIAGKSGMDAAVFDGPWNLFAVQKEALSSEPDGMSSENSVFWNSFQEAENNNEEKEGVREMEGKRKEENSERSYAERLKETRGRVRHC